MYGACLIPQTIYIEIILPFSPYQLCSVANNGYTASELQEM